MTGLVAKHQWRGSVQCRCMPFWHVNNLTRMPGQHPSRMTSWRQLEQIRRQQLEHSFPVSPSWHLSGFWGCLHHPRRLGTVHTWLCTWSWRCLATMKSQWGQLKQAIMFNSVNIKGSGLLLASWEMRCLDCLLFVGTSQSEGKPRQIACLSS